MSDVPEKIDRRVHALDVPFNARTADKRVDNPHKRGEQIVVTVSTRDDTLGRLYARRQIKEHQFAAGRHLQASFEVFESVLKASDPAKDVISGGLGSATERYAKAAKEIANAEKTLGKRAFQLVRDVLLIGYGIEEAAAARGHNTKYKIEHVGGSFRDALDDLADLFGYRITGSAKKRPINSFRA